MRKVAIVTLEVAIEVAQQEDNLQAHIADTLQETITSQMQRFNAGKGSLVDWRFSETMIRIVSTDTAPEEYDDLTDYLFSNDVQDIKFLG